MKEITVEKAKAYLLEAAQMNPGPWAEHSRYVALAAKNIASALHINTGLAEAYGYLHDIGRRFGPSKMRHTIDGYNFLVSEGYDDAARICLTHSFPTFKAEESLGEWDVCREEFDFVKHYLSAIEPNVYDRLLQLCDALALPSGFTILDRRLLDVTLRYGVDENTLSRWRGFLKIQIDFETEIGKSIYSLLPGIEISVLEVKLEETLGLCVK